MKGSRDSPRALELAFFIGALVLISFGGVFGIFAPNLATLVASLISINVGAVFLSTFAILFHGGY